MSLGRTPVGEVATHVQPVRVDAPFIEDWAQRDLAEEGAAVGAATGDLAGGRRRTRVHRVEPLSQLAIVRIGEQRLDRAADHLRRGEARLCFERGVDVHDGWAAHGAPSGRRDDDRVVHGVERCQEQAGPGGTETGQLVGTSIGREA